MGTARLVTLAAALLLLLPLASSASATQDVVQTITASDGVDSDWFGADIEVHGDKMLVGATGKDTDSGVGGAYVFRRQGGQWAEEQLLLPSVTTTHFGGELALGDDIAVVTGITAPWLPYGRAVFVYEYDGATWSETALLQAESEAEVIGFGSSLAVANGLILVGASADSFAAERAGAVYLFEKVGGQWEQMQRLVAWDAESFDGFGSAVAATSDLIMIGAPYGASSEGPQTGGIYAFRRGNDDWYQVDKFKPADPPKWLRFGMALDLNGTTVAAGVPSENHSRGAVYLYEMQGDDWVEVQKIEPAVSLSGLVYGASVSFEGEMLVVGADGESFVYRRAPSDFALVEHLAPGTESNLFQEVAIWNGDALWAAPHEAAGAVLHYDISADPSWPCTITGTSGADLLVGTDGDDVICGYGGDDTIYGKRGNDVLKGGSGDDKLYAGYGFDFLFGNDGHDVLIGGAQGDYALGGPGDDVLRGKGGDDELAGNAGDDRLFGGKGADTLLGGAGTDACHGGLGVNTFAGCE